MGDLFSNMKKQLKEKNRSIVFPESLDDRILNAVAKLSAEKILTPILIGERDKIMSKEKELGIHLNGCRIMNPKNYSRLHEMVELFVQRRNGKVTFEQAQILLQDQNYFSTMLVYLDEADGMISGAVHATSDTVRPALQIIKTKDGISKTSGLFIMSRGEETYVFADCAINIAPTSQDLAEIAVTSAKTAEIFGLTPRVALLSFSTKGSAKSPETDKVIEALKIAKEMEPDVIIDGEFQFDAAFVPSVAKKKAPYSSIKGNANVFIFPNLEAGNIGYKIAQRLGQFEAIGPILQGLNKPVNDLSRGCNSEDVYKLAIITAMQTIHS